MVNMTHFGYSHLRPDLAAISASFGELAHAVLNTLPMNAERTTCLRKLLEAKDCAVRAYLEGSTPPAAGGREQAEHDARNAEAQVAEDAKRVPTPEEDGVGAPMSAAGAESEAVLTAGTAAPVARHKARGKS